MSTAQLVRRKKILVPSANPIASRAPRAKLRDCDRSSNMYSVPFAAQGTNFAKLFMDNRLRLYGLRTTVVSAFTMRCVQPLRPLLQ